MRCAVREDDNADNQEGGEGDEADSVDHLQRAKFKDQTTNYKSMLTMAANIQSARTEWMNSCNEWVRVTVGGG